jgi:hypothetical protein
LTKLTDAIDELKTKYDSLLNETLSKIEELDWWTDDFSSVLWQETKHHEQIGIWKKTWVKDKEDYTDAIGFWISGIDFDSIIRHSDEIPSASIWCTKGVKRFGIDQEEFTNELYREIQKIPSLAQMKKTSCYYYYNLPESSTQLIEAIKDGKVFMEIILKHFNNLASSIDIIDKTLEKNKKKLR